MVLSSRQLHFLSFLKSLIFLFCHQFHGDFSLQQLDASVAQVFTHKILQVKPREICNEDHLGVVVQTALNIL